MNKSIGTSLVMKGKKLRYGSASAAFTVAFVALVIIINVIFSTLASHYMWYIDMTQKEIFSLSEPAEAALENVEDDVLITFCMPKDRLEEDQSMFYIHNTAQLLESRFDNIKIEYRDALTDIDYLSKFTTTSSPYVYTTSVIVSSGTEYRKMAYSYFFITDTDTDTVWAYDGENKFASAILAVTADEMPIAYFTIGHGEDIMNSDNSATAFVNIISEAGYDVRPIDLSTEDMDPAARLLLVVDPQYDFGGYYEEHKGKSEIEKIDEFLDGRGSMMVFVSPETVGGLTNLTEFLEEWGIKFNPGMMVEDLENSVSVDGFSVVGQYNTAEDELASSIYSGITSMSSQPKAIFREATPISHAWVTDDHSTTDLGTRMVSDIFVTSPDARLYKDGVPTDAVDTYSMMTITQEYKIIDNEDYTSYVIAAGTPDFVSSENLISTTRTNRDVIHSCLIALGKKNVPAGIQFKTFANYDLDITTAQASAWTKALIITLPLCTVAVAVFVCVRRRYK